FGHATRVNQIITELLKAKKTSSEETAARSDASTTTATTTPATVTATATATTATGVRSTSDNETSSTTSSLHTIYIVSDAPQFIFQDVIALGAIYRNAKVDAGVVQPLAYSVDRQKTIEGVKGFLARRDEMIQHEIAWLAQVGANCVLADAPFLPWYEVTENIPLAAASAYGIPACLITNFTFDEVYRFLREGDPMDKDVIACADAALEDYKRASLLLRLPGSIDIPSFKDEIFVLERSNQWNRGLHSGDSSLYGLRMDDLQIHGAHAPNQQQRQGRKSSESQEESMDDATPSGFLSPTNSVLTDASLSPNTLSYSRRKYPQQLSVDTGKNGSVEYASDYSSFTFPQRRGEKLGRIAIDVPLVVRKAINTREDVLRSLGVDEETIRTKKMVLVSFGGQRLKQGWGNPLPEGWIGVICGLPVSHELPDGFYRSPHGVYVPDLTHAADIVIGKLGYGTCSECIAHDTPLIYVSRPQFIEEQGLIKLMMNHGLPVEMTAEEFETGLWQRSILEADRLDQEEKEGRRLSSLENSRDNDNNSQVHDIPGESSQCSPSDRLRRRRSVGKMSALQQRQSKAKSLAESVNMAEMARGGPISPPVDYDEDPPLMSPARSRRSASITSLSSATMKSKRNSADDKTKQARLEAVADTHDEHDGCHGNMQNQQAAACQQQQQQQHQVDEAVRNSDESQDEEDVIPKALKAPAAWFDRRIPHNGGEVCARLIEEFMLVI
ncbi:hypothetical protein BGZ51_007522, partial [Haplosporangium sp. Z 767]